MAEETDARADRIWSGATPEEVAAAVAPLVDFEDAGVDLEELSALIDARLVPHLVDYDRPGFQSMFNAVPEAGAALGARVALAFNQGVTNWQVSPGGAVLEEACCRALCRLFGLAETADATFLYSGTYANQQALYMALHRHAQRCGFDLAAKGLAGFDDPARLTVLASRGAHYSVRHAARMLGLGENALDLVDVDDRYRLEPAVARRRVLELKGHRDLICLVATTGTTTTGAVDPLPDVADVCEEEGIWLHADGAYGLAYALLPERRSLFAGLERADSITWDPHKQMGVPIPCSVLFARDGTEFGRMAIHSAYFNREGTPEPNPGLKSPPSTRPLSALPLVASIRHLGLDGLRERLRAPVAAMEELARRLAEDPEIEVAHQPDTGVLCFRVVPNWARVATAAVPDSPPVADAEPRPGGTVPPRGPAAGSLDDLQERVFAALSAGGERTISISELDGSPVLRLAAVSPKVTVDALLETVAAVKVAARETVSAG